MNCLWRRFKIRGVSCRTKPRTKVRSMPGEMIQYLPAIYQVADEISLLAHVLAAFDDILLKQKAGTTPRKPAIEELVADIACFLDPRDAPSDFLPWLAGWAALTLTTDIPESRQREILARIIPLYARRGTVRGICQMVALFTGGTLEIQELPDAEFQIEDHSTIGTDTYLGGPPPHVFHAVFSLSEAQADEREERAKSAQLQTRIARAVIEMSKPAHTWFTLESAPDRIEREPPD